MYIQRPPHQKTIDTHQWDKIPQKEQFKPSEEGRKNFLKTLV